MENDNDAQATRKEMFGRILTPREKQVIAMRFGFGTGDSMTLAQVGDNMGVTRERIRQIESKALRKLRGHPRLQHLKDYLD